MLKTLEEPPEYLKFVLATTDPQKVPVTVLSRCLQFNLRPMAPETVLEHLERVLQAENVSADTQALRLLARAARGSMRDALSLTDQAIAFGSGKLEEAAVRQMLGSVDRSHVFRLIDALAQGDGKSVVEISAALRVHGLSAAAALEEMSLVLQRMAVLQAVPGMATADNNDPDAQETARLAQQMPADETQLLYSLCLHGRAELGLAPDEYAGLTMVLLRLLAFKPAASGAVAEKKTLNEVPARVPADAQAISGASVAAIAPAAQPDAMAPAPAAPPATEPERSSPPAAAQPPGYVLPVVVPPTAVPHAGASTAPQQGQPASKVVAVPLRIQPEPGQRTQPREEGNGTERLAPTAFIATEEGDLWHATVQQLVAAEAVTALVRELALQSQLIARDGDHWMLRVERESLNQPTSRERLRQALSSAGHAAQISVEVGAVTDSPARRNAAAAAQRQLEAENTVANDPFVQTLVQNHAAKIAPGNFKFL
jgi:DNA polymerase-3 subunit gamma/tau